MPSRCAPPRPARLGDAGWQAARLGDRRRPAAWLSQRHNAPASRCLRHTDRCDEYSMSPRAAAARRTSPGFEHPSASRTTRTLYSAVNLRRRGRSTNWGSGAGTAGSRDVRFHGRLRLPAPDVRWPRGLLHRCCSTPTFLCLRPRLLLSNYPTSIVSPHVGREVAYVEVLPAEDQHTCTAFLQRAVESTSLRWE